MAGNETRVVHSTFFCVFERGEKFGGKRGGEGERAEGEVKIVGSHRCSCSYVR